MPFNQDRCGSVFLTSGQINMWYLQASKYARLVYYSDLDFFFVLVNVYTQIMRCDVDTEFWPA